MAWVLLAMQIGPTWEKQWPGWWCWRSASILLWSLLEIIWGWHCHLQRWRRLSSRFWRRPCQIHYLITTTLQLWPNPFILLLV